MLGMWGGWLVADDFFANQIEEKMFKSKTIFIDSNTLIINQTM